MRCDKEVILLISNIVNTIYAAHTNLSRGFYKFRTKVGTYSKLSDGSICVTFVTKGEGLPKPPLLHFRDGLQCIEVIFNDRYRSSKLEFNDVQLIVIVIVCMFVCLFV